MLNYLKQGLDLQDLSANETDIIYVQDILSLISQTQVSLSKFPDLKQELPITIIDKGELIYK